MVTQAITVVEIESDMNAGANNFIMMKTSSSTTQMSRCFWKAGECAAGPTAFSSPSQGHLEHARVHPKFLHTNATSHKWVFGAIAELLDNAVDEIEKGATFVKVDKIDVMKDGSPALLIQDDGAGMDPEGIRKCMYLGCSAKKSNTLIGQYGNGFKTSTMRLGADAIVLSCAIRAGKATQSAGLLSYTFLCTTGQDDIIVPMVGFDNSGHSARPIVHSSLEDWSPNLKIILEWSPFSSEEELLEQFENIGPHGTKIIIYNLWLNDEGIYELSFHDEDRDIQLYDEANQLHQTRTQKNAIFHSHISYRFRYSLRAYASILYRRKFKNFNILLMGKPVQQYNIIDDLQLPKVAKYKPQLATGAKEVTVETTIGFSKEASAYAISGFNIYHKNRLIMPFWKVVREGSLKANGVLGVLEANFIQPTHDKQDFERSSAFVRLEARLKQMEMEYWRTNRNLVDMEELDPTPTSSDFNIEKESKGKASCSPNIEQQISSTQLLGWYDQINAPMEEVVAEFSAPSHCFLALGGDMIPEDDDGLWSLSVEQLCDRNIELYMRCEEHRQKESALKQMIDGLEIELEQARKKYDQLAASVETRRNLHGIEHEIQMVV